MRGGITAFLAHIYLAEGGGVHVEKGGVHVVKGGVYLSGPKLLGCGLGDTYPHNTFYTGFLYAKLYVAGPRVPSFTTMLPHETSGLRRL